MDAGTVRGLITLALMLAFIGLVAWVYGRRRKAHFDEIAKMPFREGAQQNKRANSDE